MAKQKKKDEASEVQKQLVIDILKDIESLGISDMAGYKNLLAIKNFTVATREMARTLEAQVNESKKLIVAQNHVIDNLQQQVNRLQAKLYSGAATS